MADNYILQSLTLITIGFLLGVFFFAGTRFSVKIMREAASPQLIWLLSMIIRFSVVGAGLWYASGQISEKLAIMTFGLIIARLVMIHPSQLKNCDGCREGDRPPPEVRRNVTQSGTRKKDLPGKYRQISKILIIITALTATACAAPVSRLSYSHGNSLSGYKNIKFGTPQASVMAALSGRKLQMSENAVSYPDIWAGANFYVTQFFHDGKAATAVLDMTESRLVRTRRECGQWYNYFAGQLQYIYGHADVASSDEKLESGRHIILRITFSDSSHIDLYYDFDATKTANACTIKIYFQPIWAKKLCLITNNRFCETDSNFIYLGD